MSDLIEKINKLKLQVQLSPLGGATCDARLLFNVLDEVEKILNTEPSKALECLEKIISYFDNPQYELGSGYSCKNELLENYENEVNAIKQALIQANQYIGARRNGKELEQMHQLVQYSKKPMKPAIWIARIDDKLEQRVVMEKEDYDKLQIKAQDQEKALNIIKKKKVDTRILRNCLKDETPEHYNFLNDKHQLTQEEFDLLKKILKD